MATRTPLVLVGGEIQQLAAGDSLAGGSAGVPVGGLLPVVAGFPTAGTDYLPANGADVTASTYPTLAAMLPAATSATLRGLPEGVTIGAVAYGNGYFVAVVQSANNYVLTSNDGQNWGVRMIGSLTGTYYQRVIYGNGMFLMSASDTVYNYIYASPDGISWRLVFQDSLSRQYDDGAGNVDYALIASLRYENGVFFACIDCYQYGVGTIYHYYTSTNGTTWTRRAMPNYLYRRNTGVAYGAGVYVMVDANGYTLSSTDYITWTPRTNTPTGSGGWSSVAYGNGVFVSVQGWLAAGTSTGYSTNGTTWTQKTIPSGRYYSVIYANGMFVAVGLNALMTSTDGQTWTARTVPNATWYEITYNATYGFVVVSNNGTQTLQSTDGITWTASAVDGLVIWSDVCYGSAAGFLAVNASSHTATSTDGLSWTQRYSGSAGPNGGVTYCPTLGLYVGYNGTTIYSSTDGTAWTSRYALSSITKIRWLNDKVVALLGNGAMYWSSDAITWYACTGTLGGSFPYTGVAYGNGIYIAVTGASKESRAASVSNGGVNWMTSYSLPAQALWTDVAFGNGVFVAISRRYPAQAGSGLQTLAGNIGSNTFSGDGSLSAIDTPDTTGRICAVSSNGTAWVAGYLPVVGEWNSITFNGHVFIATDGLSSNYAVSRDGLNWNLRSAPAHGQWNAIASNQATNVSVAVPNGIPSASMRITESATSVMLPFVKPDNGVNVIVRVK